MYIYIRTCAAPLSSDRLLFLNFVFTFRSPVPGLGKKGLSPLSPWEQAMCCSVFYPPWQGRRERRSLLEPGQAGSGRAVAQALPAASRGHGVSMLLPAPSDFHMLTFPTLLSLRLFM